jgi:hypothetical protein
MILINNKFDILDLVKVPKEAGDMRRMLADAALRGIATQIMGWFLYSLSGLGEGCRKEATAMLFALGRSARLPRKSFKEMFSLPQDEFIRQSDLFRWRNLKEDTVFTRFVEKAAEGLMKTWEEREKSRHKVRSAHCMEAKEKAR